MHHRPVLTLTLRACLCMTASHAASASDDQRFIGVECHPQQGVFRISYHADRLHALFSEGFLVDTFLLKKNAPTGEHVESLRSINKTCRIGKTSYTVRLRAIPGNWNLNGMCGGLTFGGATISANGKMVVDREFERCNEEEITTAITFRGGSVLPIIHSSNKVQP